MGWLFFSFPAVCGFGYCIGLRSSLPFCSTLWAYKRVNLHGHLFVDGLSLGNGSIFNILSLSCLHTLFQFSPTQNRAKTGCMLTYKTFLHMQVMSVKALGTSLKLTFEGMNQIIYPQTWFFMLVVLTCVITQMNYLNKVSDGIIIPIVYNVLIILLGFFLVDVLAQLGCNSTAFVFLSFLFLLVLLPSQMNLFGN